jgi:hypothetical protein
VAIESAFSENAVDDHRPTMVVSGGTGGMRLDHRGVRVAQMEGTDNQDCHPDDDCDDYDDCDLPSDDRDGAYEEGGIVFDDPLGSDKLALDTKIAIERVCPHILDLRFNNNIIRQYLEISFSKYSATCSTYSEIRRQHHRTHHCPRSLYRPNRFIFAFGLKSPIC